MNIYDIGKLTDTLVSHIGDGDDFVKEALENHLPTLDVDRLVNECQERNIDYSDCLKEE